MKVHGYIIDLRHFGHPQNDHRSPRGFRPQGFGCQAFGPCGHGLHGFGPHAFRSNSFRSHAYGPHAFGPHAFGLHAYGAHPFEPHAYGLHDFGPHVFGPHGFGSHRHGKHGNGNRGHDGRGSGRWTYSLHGKGHGFDWRLHITDDDIANDISDSESGAHNFISESESDNAREITENEGGGRGLIRRRWEKHGGHKEIGGRYGHNKYSGRRCERVKSQRGCNCKSGRKEESEKEQSSNKENNHAAQGTGPAQDTPNNAQDIRVATTDAME